jgi:hypothetical protein
MEQSSEDRMNRRRIVARTIDTVGSQEGRPPRRDRLTRARVIEAALEIMDAEGVDAVTMRRIGRELGVEAMPLYNHVRDKVDIPTGSPSS